MRLIDADALKAKAFGKRGGLIHTSDIDEMPTAQPHDYSDGFVDGYKQGRKDAQPERTGKWIRNPDDTCGAKMEPEDIPMEYFESGGR